MPTILRAAQPRVIAIPLAAGASFNPADATTYRFGNQPGSNPGTADSVFSVVIPRAATIVGAAGGFTVAGTLGSSENVTVRVRNVTQGTTQDITTTAKMNAVTNLFGSTSLSLAVAANDLIANEVVTPTWATNPTVVFMTATVDLEYA
jgi:hypothetical protein